jgi:hypothetical protein
MENPKRSIRDLFDVRFPSFTCSLLSILLLGLLGTVLLLSDRVSFYR